MAMRIEVPRAVCPACRRPEIVCYCAHVTPLTTRTRVVILQHPRERDVPVNTARIASLCLPDAELHVGVEWHGERAERLLSDPARPAALLFPGPGAIDVEERPPAGPITLVVVDGTWWQAQKIVRKNPKLAALPRYAFRPPAPSEYRIRREPHEDYVSTIEALVHVLGVLEGDRDRFRAILVPFRRMVEMQLAFAEKSSAPRRVLVRKRRAPVDPRTRIPAILRERAADLVCVYAEANAWPYDASERERPADELVQWVACRPATGETFESILAPRRPLCPATPFHLGLEPEVLARGESPGAMLERWSRFVRPSDVLCAWGEYTSELFAEGGGTLEHPPVDLRRVAREFARERVGSLETFRARVRADAPPPTATGRAGLRLASLVAITRFFAAC